MSASIKLRATQRKRLRTAQRRQSRMAQGRQSRIAKRRRLGIAQRRRRLLRRLDKRDNRGSERPIITASNVHYEVADRIRATAAGGIGAIHQMVRKLGLDEAINRRVPLLKLNRPYHESDHVLNIAYNLLAGGACLEHLEHRREDEAYLDALGARRIPDPTTAGDFCRRFGRTSIDALQETFNAVRRKVWSRQPDAFFDEAILDADGTLVETTGECKQGMDINYKGQWGYEVLVLSLANTGEPLYLVAKPGNRPSHEEAPAHFDRAIHLCREAGFRKILLRGDTDFSQTEHLDRWDDAGDVRFVFGINATDAQYVHAGDLPPQAWETLVRPPKYQVKTKPRRRRPKFKQQVVETRKFKDLRLVKEQVAEFAYQPVKCQRPYRVVVVWKEVHVHRGQLRLFDEASRGFFYITNDWEAPAAEIVFLANGRCHQENLLQQLKSGVRSLTAPVDSLLSNWAYMVMASLAWSLKAWTALLLPEGGRWKEVHRREKLTLLRMDFASFRQALLNVPAQILRGGRRIVYRLLGCNGWQHVLFRLLDQLRLPLRC